MYLYRNDKLTIAERVFLASINAIYARKHNRPLIWINMTDNLENFNNFIESNPHLGIYFSGEKSNYYNSANEKDIIVHDNLSKLLLTIYNNKAIEVEGYFKTGMDSSLFWGLSLAFTKNVVVTPDTSTENIFRNVYNYLRPARTFGSIGDTSDTGVADTTSSIYEEFKNAGGIKRGLYVTTTSDVTLVDFAIYNKFFIIDYNEFETFQVNMAPYSIIYGKSVEPVDDTIFSLNCERCDNLLDNYLMRNATNSGADIKKFTMSEPDKTKRVLKKAHYVSFVYYNDKLSSLYHNGGTTGGANANLFKKGDKVPIAWSIPEFYTYYSSVFYPMIKKYQENNEYILTPRVYKGYSMPFFADVQKYINKSKVKHLLVRDSTDDVSGQNTLTNITTHINNLDSIIYFNNYSEEPSILKVDDAIVFNSTYNINSTSLDALKSDDLVKDVSNLKSYSIVLIKESDTIESIQDFIGKLPKGVIPIGLTNMVSMIKNHVNFSGSESKVDTSGFFYKIKDLNVYYIVTALLIFILIMTNLLGYISGYNAYSEYSGYSNPYGIK